MAMTVVTANRLSDGAVVYLASQGRWTTGLAEALVVSGDEVEALLGEAEQAVTRRVVVGPYALDVETGPDGVYPCHVREVIRAAGPTVGTDFGRRAGPPASA